MKKVDQFLENYINEIRKYILSRDRLISIYSNNNSKHYVSEGFSNAKYIDGLLIRTEDTIKITEYESKKNELFEFIHNKIVKPDDYYQKYQHDIFELQQSLLQTINNISRIYGKNIKLCHLIYNSIGYVTYDYEEAYQVHEKSDSKAFFLEWFLRDILDSFLRKNKILDYNSFLNFNVRDWINYHNNVVDKLINRSVYRYRACIYLNAPFCTSKNGEKFIRLEIKNKIYQLFAKYASDEEINSIELDNSKRSLLKFINTVIYYDITIPIKANVNEFEEIYVAAEGLTKELLTWLRLIYDFEVGVFCIKIIANGTFTPKLRGTYNFAFNNDYSTYFPKRYLFYSSYETVLSNKREISILKKVINSSNKIKGFDVAIRRLNSFIDGFYQNDFQRLLDLTIAFESIYLNDQESKSELSLRLCIRASRFLRKEFDERLKVYAIIHDLYKYRSEIAHGDKQDGFSSKDLLRLKEINQIAPILLRESLIKLLLNKPVTNWIYFWKRITLG